MVDLALLFADLLSAPGVTQAELGRRYRKSAGYVSVVCRLGRALRELPPEARDALRVPHFTLKAAQSLVSRHADPAALRAAAVRLAAAPPVGVGARPGATRARARHGAPGQWERAPDGPDPIDPLPEPPDAMARRDAFTYTWDAEAARRDPRAVLAEFEAFVRTATDEVVRRLRRAAGDVGSGPAHEVQFAPTGRPSVRAVRTSTEGDEDLGERPFARGFDDTTLRRLDARVADTLRAHRARMDAFLKDREKERERCARPATPRAPTPGAGPGRGGSFAPIAVDPADLDADLG